LRSKQFSSTGCGLSGGEVVKHRLDCIVSDHHHFENGLATANFLPNSQDRALRAEAFWMIVGILTLVIDSSA
jgi:hypothetical protein